MMKFNNVIIGGILGLIVALLLVTIGFFKTVFVILLTVLGAGAGFILKRKNINLLDYIK